MFVRNLCKLLIESRIIFSSVLRIELSNDSVIFLVLFFFTISECGNNLTSSGNISVF